MTGPALHPDTGLPPVHRVLNPDEFEQAQQMSPEALATHPFPVVPPAAPKDATAQIGAGGAASVGKDPVAFGATRLAGILTRQVAKPILEHPFLAAGGAVATAAFPPLGYLWMGMMGKDVLEYSAQKAAESTLDAHTRALAEQDPGRISGEQASTEALMMGLGAHAPGATADVSGGMMEAGVEGMGKSLDASAGVPLSATELRTQRVQAAVDAGRKARAAKAGQLEDAIKSHIDDVADGIRTAFPSGEISAGAQSRNILRANLGLASANVEQALFKVDEFRRAIDPLSDTDKLGFKDAIQGGESQASPLFQRAADTMRERLDDRRDVIRGLGEGDLDSYIENYFPQEWTDPDKAASVFSSRRPLEGDQGFLKHRTIPTNLEGIANGLEEKYPNPVDGFMSRMQSMNKYIAARTSWQQHKEAGLLQYVPTGAEVPAGFEGTINDNIAKVFGPRQGAVSLPEGAVKGVDIGPRGGMKTRGASEMSPEDVSVPGIRTMGTWRAPRDVAQNFNNYLSPGLSTVLRNTIPGKAGEVAATAYDAYRGLGNTINQSRVSASAFHIMLSTLDPAAGRFGLALKNLGAGNYGKAATDAATAPFAGLPALMQGTVGDLANHLLGTKFQIGLGAQIREAIQNPERASPEMAELANMAIESNMSLSLSNDYRTSAPAKMVAAWADGTLAGKAKAAGYFIPAALQTFAKPIMEHIVPLQKFAAFGDMARYALDNMDPEATLTERQAAIGKIGDMVENRLGQLNQDNLFWHRAFRDAAQGAVAFVGFNIGTVRLGIGGAKDLLLRANDPGMEGMSFRASYLTGLAIQTALTSLTYQYLRTGKGPESLKDLYHPQNGQTDADGNPERMTMPGYGPKLISMAEHPVNSAIGLANPLLSLGVQSIRNEDFYSNEIYNLHDPFVKRMQQEADYVGKAVLPFSLSNTQESRSRGDTTTATAIGNAFAIRPANEEDVRTPAQNLLSDYTRHMTGSTPEETEKHQLRANVVTALRSGDSAAVRDAVQQALERGGYQASDLAAMAKVANVMPKDVKFKALTIPQAIDVFNAAEGDEKAHFGHLLAQRIQVKAVRGVKFQ